MHTANTAHPHKMSVFTGWQLFVFFPFPLLSNYLAPGKNQGINFTNFTLFIRIDSDLIASEMLRAQVLNSYASLLRVQRNVFRGDPRALDIARTKTRLEFTKYRDLSSPPEVSARFIIYHKS